MDAMDDVYGNLLEQKESKSTDIERSPVEEEKKKKKTVSPEKEKKKKKKTVSPEKAAKKRAKKAWDYAKKQLAKPGPESDGILGPDDVKEISHITAVQAKLAAFKYSSAEYTTRDHDAKKLLALNGMQQGLTALTNVVNTAIVTSGSAKLATDGMFHHVDVDFVMAVYWGKWNVRGLSNTVPQISHIFRAVDTITDATAPYDPSTTFVLMKKVLLHFNGRKLGSPHQVFPEWMRMLDRDPSFDEGKLIKYDDTDGLKVILFASYIMTITHNYTGSQALMPVLKLMKHDIDKVTAYDADTGKAAPVDAFGNLCFDWTIALHLFGSLLLGTSGNPVRWPLRMS
jgi:hypothetical protein